MKWLQIASGVVVLAALCSYMSTVYIHPDEIGVRRSVTDGIAKEDFWQGRHLDLPFVHSWYRLPSTIQYMEFAGDKVLDLRTKENNILHIDVLIPYRILAGEAHKIVSEGYATAYHAKVASVSEGFLRDFLPQLTNDAVQKPEERERVARAATKELNARLRQYHVQLAGKLDIVFRAIYFDPPYEEQLQTKQVYAVQAMLDKAKQDESQAKQTTDTAEKGIEKDVAVETETWNNKIAETNKEFVEKIAKVNADSVAYDKKVRSEADAGYERMVAAGEKAVALAEATGKRLEAEALASRAGRTYSAIEAAKRFKLGPDIELNSSDPRFLSQFASMSAWRAFFGAAD